MKGIVVFQPRPPEAAHQAVVDFRCPQCDATTAYSVASGGLTCTHCGYHEAAAQDRQGTAAAGFEFTLETVTRAARGWGVARQELTCGHCGARTTLPAGSLSATCPLCGANQVVQARAVQDSLRPRFLIPFSVTEETCRRRTADWLGSSWLAPGQLRRLAVSAEFTPLYLPFWTFSARTSAAWRAEVAHIRTVSVKVNDH